MKLFKQKENIGQNPSQSETQADGHRGRRRILQAMGAVLAGSVLMTGCGNGSQETSNAREAGSANPAITAEAVPGGASTHTEAPAPAPATVSPTEIPSPSNTDSLSPEQKIHPDWRVDPAHHTEAERLAESLKVEDIANITVTYATYDKYAQVAGDGGLTHTTIALGLDLKRGDRYDSPLINQSEILDPKKSTAESIDFATTTLDITFDGHEATVVIPETISAEAKGVLRGLTGEDEGKAMVVRNISDEAYVNIVIDDENGIPADGIHPISVKTGIKDMHILNADGRTEGRDLESDRGTYYVVIEGGKVVRVTHNADGSPEGSQAGQ